MKLFISADIEGTCGIAAWQETNTDNQYSKYFETQMSNEVAAACRGAMRAGFDEIVIKDAHDTARNILPDLLPENVKLLRGWPGNPYCMLSGIDDTFDAVFYTGYHSAASTSGNPLSHTMHTQIGQIRINGIVTSEFYIGALTASYLSVPSALLTGDKLLCETSAGLLPSLRTVAVSEGFGNGSLSLQPSYACRLIEEKAYEALSGDYKKGVFTMPGSFTVEVQYNRHFDAYSASFYPGCERTDDRTVRFECKDWYEALRMMHFTL
ncbi:MAG TPA: M55 family metallopeptidase [Bacillota bacterium]|nr:M55 family metallopeptidase [Bacillota bacterium]